MVAPVTTPGAPSGAEIVEGWAAHWRNELGYPGWERSVESPIRRDLVEKIDQALAAPGQERL